MNKINPKKLLNSKWTAVIPINKEKHFVIDDIKFDEEVVVFCQMQAIISKRTFDINWIDLKNDSEWKQGWK